ncbi:MAG TPA: hypothetical protein VGI40_12990 [Pirellulaceae bacterium]|jgi:hypothetical protein
MKSQTMPIDNELPHLRGDGTSVPCQSLPSGQFQFGSAVMDEWQEMPPSCQPVICRTSALEVFSQACSTYIDCELGWPAESPDDPSTFSAPDFPADGSMNSLHVARADARSVDAALPLLLNEIEAFIANLREEDCSEVYSA